MYDNKILYKRMEKFKLREEKCMEGGRMKKNLIFLIY